MFKSSSNSKNNRYIPFKLSPQPRDNNSKWLIISKNKSKEKKWNKRKGIASKFSERNKISKPPLKGGLLNKNAFNKEYIGLNSAKSIFMNKNKNTLIIYTNNNIIIILIIIVLIKEYIKIMLQKELILKILFHLMIKYQKKKKKNFKYNLGY